MKSFAFLTLASAAHLSPMEPPEMLHNLESCYHAMEPAFENNIDAFIWLSDIPHPLFNAVMHLSSPLDRVDQILQTIPSEKPISFWVHHLNQTDNLEETLKERGFAPVITCAVMGWPVEKMGLREADIRPADPDTFYQIIASVFHFDENISNKYAALMESISAENYSIYLEGKPVCTGTLFPNGNTGGIFNIATLPEYRKRGLANAMMRHLMDRANKLKLKNLVLLSSQEAEHLYSTLGFQKGFDVAIYTR